jgi:2-polyprenyl-3-methyl-5-hydroxy-6-metoxy-1,4-benzoquinol methylase
VNAASLAGDYYQIPRHDIAALIPVDCKRVLEVGAGFGALGALLKQRGLEELDAVEFNPAAAAHLQDIYRQFWIGDVEKVELDGASVDYDCIVFPDVLEHLVDPWSAMRRLVARLRPSGIVVASLPNVRNIGLLYRLVVQGRWDYEDSGLLDRTHLRFFTKKSIVDLFESNGLSIEVWHMNRDAYKGARRVVATVARLFISEIDVCQYLVRARKL